MKQNTKVIFGLAKPPKSTWEKRLSSVWGKHRVVFHIQSIETMCGQTTEILFRHSFDHSAIAKHRSYAVPRAQITFSAHILPKTLNECHGWTRR